MFEEMQFRSEIVKDKDAPEIRVNIEAGVPVIRLNGFRVYSTLCQRKLIVGALNKVMDELVEETLMKMAKKEIEVSREC